FRSRDRAHFETPDILQIKIARGTFGAFDDIGRAVDGDFFPRIGDRHCDVVNALFLVDVIAVDFVESATQIQDRAAALAAVAPVDPGQVLRGRVEVVARTGGIHEFGDTDSAAKAGQTTGKRHPFDTVQERGNRAQVGIAQGTLGHTDVEAARGDRTG